MIYFSYTLHYEFEAAKSLPFEIAVTDAIGSTVRSILFYYRSDKNISEMAHDDNSHLKELY